MTKVWTAGTACGRGRSTVGLPPWRGPLKRVSGEPRLDRLPAEGDHRADVAGADDRVRAAAARASCGGGSCELRGLADRQAGGVEPAVAVEVEHDLLQRRPARCRRPS